VVDIHHGEIEALQAHEAIQWLAHKIDQKLKTSAVWWTNLPKRMAVRSSAGLIPRTRAQVVAPLSRK
jgi:hypothetical protein